jgi:hypothetical protein
MNTFFLKYETSRLYELQETINQLLTRLFYTLLDTYESQMSYPNDMLSQSPDQVQVSTQSGGNMDSMPSTLTDDQISLADSIHIFAFDLINLIGQNYKHLGQKHLLDIMLKKLTTTISLADISNRDSGNNQQPPPHESTRRKTNVLLTFIRNKMSLINLCTQFIEPNDLTLFNMYYTNVLTAIKSILYNNNSQLDAQGININPIDILNQKFSIVLQLLAKFSFINLERLVEVNHISSEKCEQICTEFIDTNLNFLTDLNFSFDLINFQTNNHLKLIIDQCINNYVSILNINYPTHFLLIMKKCFEFNAKEYSLKYGSLNLKRFLGLFQQNEMMAISSPMKNSPMKSNTFESSINLRKIDYENIFEYLIQFFRFEQAKFKSQKNSFYLHWSMYTSELARLYSSLTLTYFERFLLKTLNSSTGSNFEREFDKSIWKLISDLYMVWIEPASLIEVTSQFFINIKDLYDNNQARLSGAASQDNNYETISSHTTPQLAIFIMFDSFLSVFDSVCKHLLQQATDSNKRNFLLNKFLQFYYEQIVSSSHLSNPSTVNDNTLGKKRYF